MSALKDIAATAPVWASDSQYYLYGTEFDPTGFTYTHFNGLLAPLRPGTGIGVPGTFAVILTGLETGYVTVTLELHPHPSTSARPGRLGRDRRWEPEPPGR
ncbi:hypothetical protein [Streptomyces sp. NPDC096339]|uniref:hypothetical protein n=1 Tax=Streptomyces sp. NPDC096339 TaxID=3366086 RepID=UPI00382F0870